MRRWHDACPGKRQEAMMGQQGDGAAALWHIGTHAAVPRGPAAVAREQVNCSCTALQLGVRISLIAKFVPADGGLCECRWMDR